MTDSGAEESGITYRAPASFGALSDEVPTIAEVPVITKDVGFANTPRANIPHIASDHPVLTSKPSGRPVNSLAERETLPRDSNPF